MAPTLEEVMNTITNLSREEMVIVKTSEAGLYEVNIRRRPQRKEANGHDLDEEEREGLPYVDLKVAPADPDWGIIHIPKSVLEAKHFPGYKMQFILETEVKPFVMHITGSVKGTYRGEQKGGYLGHPRGNKIDPKFLEIVPDSISSEGTFRNFYRSTRVVGDDWIRIYRVSPEVYRAKIRKRGLLL